MAASNNNNHEDTFRTSETTLAAYLISEGFDLLHIDYVGDRAIFVFPNSSETLKRVVKDFTMNVASGNITAYETARRDLIARIKRKAP